MRITSFRSCVALLVAANLSACHGPSSNVTPTVTDNGPEEQMLDARRSTLLPGESAVTNNHAHSPAPEPEEARLLEKPRPKGPHH
jgi:hypothetical protein